MKSCLQFLHKCMDYYKNISKPNVFSPLFFPILAAVTYLR